MSFNKLFTSSLLLLTTFHYVSNYRILGVFQMPARSHFILGSTLMKALAEAGHDVTIIAPFRDEQLPNLQRNGSYREIIPEDVNANLREKLATNEKLGDKFLGQTKGVLSYFNTWMSTFEPVNEDTLKDQRVISLMKSNEKFDVVIVTDFFNDILKLMAYHFDASLVLFRNDALSTWYFDDIGNIALPSIIPVHEVDMPFRMSFSQRLENLFEKIRTFMFFRSHNFQQNEIARKYFPRVPSMEEVKKNVSLVLINAELSISPATQTVPCMINIGGFHISSTKKLPQDLQKIMNNASNGVIFFSFGSVVKPTWIPEAKLQEVLQMFGTRNETVLWKFGRELDDKPKNVHFGKWFPQQEILAHHNTKLFITHCGYASITEATYYGVPTLCVPFFGNHFFLAKTQVETGSGLIVNFKNFGADTIGETIEEILSNQTYREAAQRKSRIMRDKQNKPIDDAIFWVEYVVRHKGAKHLRVPHLDMSLYQVYMLDILGLILAVVIFVSIILTCCSIKMATYFKRRRNKQMAGRSVNKKIN